MCTDLLIQGRGTAETDKSNECFEDLLGMGGEDIIKLLECSELEMTPLSFSQNLKVSRGNCTPLRSDQFFHSWPDPPEEALQFRIQGDCEDSVPGYPGVFEPVDGLLLKLRRSDILTT